MKTVVILYNTCCIYEIVILNYFLKYVGKDVVFVSQDGNSIISMEGYSVNVSDNLLNISPQNVELMVVPGGNIAEIDNSNTLWNAAEAVEKQWNSQLAHRIIPAIPRKISPGTVCRPFAGLLPGVFVSKGMIADFDVHDKGTGNPHAHILLTMRALDESGKWLPKGKKVYDLDENGERIRLASGRWKSHKENTVDWDCSRQ